MARVGPVERGPSGRSVTKKKIRFPKDPPASQGPHGALGVDWHTAVTGHRGGGCRPMSPEQHEGPLVM